MKILLVNPPFTRFLGLEQDYVPLSLLAVGSKLKENGHDVFIKNMEIDKTLQYSGYENRIKNHDKYLQGIKDNNHYIWQEFREVIQKINPDKIGITVLNVKYKSTMKLVEIIKEFGIDIMVGGHHPTLNKKCYQDIEVCVGEFEGRGHRIKDLDSLPFPDFDILMDKYSPNGYAHLVSSRGCSYKCRFCASNIIWKRRVTFKSIDRIIAEMKYVHDRFYSNYFTFWDETFTINKKRVLEFCRKYNISAKWRCDTRADSIDLELLRMMKNAGCGQISMGIESGVNRILKYINKGETINQYKYVADIFNKVDMEWKAYCVVGFPEETEEDIRTTVKFVKSLNPTRITLSIFTPYQGTSLYDECKPFVSGDSSMFAHQSPYNFFSKRIPKKKYKKLMIDISSEIDLYNREVLKYWK